MNATLYDPADVAFRPDREQHEPAESAPAEQQQQSVIEQPNQRVQIGPLDV